MAAPTFQAAGTAAVATSPSDLVVSWPTHLADDIGLLIVSGVYGSGNNYAAPAGWTAVPDSPQSNSSDGLNARLQVFWKRAASGAEGAATVADVAGDDAKVGQIITFRGCIASGNPYDVTAGDNTNTSSSAVSIPGDTTTGPDRLIVAIVGHAWIDSASAQLSGWTNADLTSVTEVTDICDTTSIGYGLGAATGVKAVAGAYGATTATLAANAAQGQGRISIALKPAASYTVSGTVTIAGAAAPDGEDVIIFADNGDGTWDEVDTVQTSGGTGAFTCSVPDNTRDYFAKYDDGTNRGVSALDNPV